MEILSQEIGRKIVFLGNEAIVRGALEAGVQFVSTYPGTPASEIGNTFWKIAKKAGVYFEFSTNEKVALEAGAGAAFSGLRALVAMKNFGLNVACDFLMPLCYAGIKAGFVLVVADDPGCSSSAQSEQDSRAFSQLAHIPILEPATPQECKDFTKQAFEISEKYRIPVMLRETTRVALQAGVVKLDKIVQGKRKAQFVKDPRQFVTLPPRVLEMKDELLTKIEKIRSEVSEKSPINKAYSGLTAGGCKIGVITSGVSFLYAMEALKELKLKWPVLKPGLFNPLPEKKIKGFIKTLKKVLIIEELEPYLEREVERIAKEVNPKLQVFGKNVLPITGELRPEQVIEAIVKVAGKKWKVRQAKLPVFPKRRPQLCPGCPYWLAFQGIKNGLKELGLSVEDVVFGGEIGCYMLAGLPPHHLQDYLFCMGSSIGVGHGIVKAGNQKLIALVGDSSFFHAGITALINAVHNKSNLLVIIMDNQTTAMTGFQPHPGINRTAMGEPAPAIKIEELVMACGVKNLKVIDSLNQTEFKKAIKEFLQSQEVSVIIARRPCLRIE